MPAPDPIALRRHARSLITNLEQFIVEELRRDPVETAGTHFGLTVELRAHSAAGCDLDASLNRTTRTIIISGDATPARRRFSCLHEIAHFLIADALEVCDWLDTLGPRHMNDAEEALADQFAAEVLLPPEDVAQQLGSNFNVRALVRFIDDNTQASREACIVAAAQRLNTSGLVLMAEGRTVVFSAAKNLPLRVGRRVDQPETSPLVHATTSALGRFDNTPVMLRSGLSGATFNGDAIVAADGYTYAVLREHADYPDDPAERHRRQWSCRSCGDDITNSDWCNTCHRRICDTCGCECPPAPPPTPRPLCEVCFLRIPPAHTTCPNCS
jgi:hypothetical protein